MGSGACGRHHTRDEGEECPPGWGNSIWLVPDVAHATAWPMFLPPKQKLFVSGLYRGVSNSSIVGKQKSRRVVDGSEKTCLSLWEQGAIPSRECVIMGGEGTPFLCHCSPGSLGTLPSKVEGWKDSTGRYSALFLAYSDSHQQGLQASPLLG